MTGPTPLGGEGKTVEVDETFHGHVEGGPDLDTLHPEHGWRKQAARRQAERSSRSLSAAARPARSKSRTSPRARSARSFSTTPIPPAHLRTDEAQCTATIGRRFASHESVNHSSEEWVRGDAHIEHVEGFFSIFKRGMTGVYQHCSEAHLHRYLAEFDFRYSNRIKLGVDDTERTRLAIKGAGGKRLTYRRNS